MSFSALVLGTESIHLSPPSKRHDELWDEVPQLTMRVKARKLYGTVSTKISETLNDMTEAMVMIEDLLCCHCSGGSLSGLMNSCVVQGSVRLVRCSNQY